MKKRILSLLIALLIVQMPLNGYAKTLILQRELIGTGVNENGISYEIYLIDNDDNLAQINFPHHKLFTIQVLFTGNVTPPQYWNCTISEENISYAGTLKLNSYEFDNFFGSKTTVAEYSGTLSANI